MGARDRAVPMRCSAPTEATRLPMTDTLDASAPSRPWSLVLVPALSIAAYLTLRATGSEHALAFTAALTLWCAGWWVLEPVSPTVTALPEPPPTARTMPSARRRWAPLFSTAIESTKPPSSSRISSLP